MPYLHVKIGKALDESQAEALRRGLERIVPILPNKTVDNCMIHIEQDCAMFMRGERNPCAFVDVRLFRPSPEDKKAEFGAALASLLESVCGIPPEFFYMNLLEMDHWYTGGCGK